MKRFLNSMLILVVSMFAMNMMNAQCDYTVYLFDSWGDGLNGASVDVSINGGAPTNISAIGPTAITVNDGDALAITYNGGGFDNENTLILEDASGCPIIYVQDPQAGTQNFTASCPLECAITACPSDFVVDLGPGECRTQVSYIFEAEGNCVQDETVAQGFAGDFDPANWTAAPGTGSIDVSGAPGSVVLTSGDDGSGAPSTTSLGFTFAEDGVINLDWAFATGDAGFENFGYTLNGSFNQLDDATGAHAGNLNLCVAAGDVLSFDAITVDNTFGPGTATLSNLSFTTLSGEIQATLLSGFESGAILEGGTSQQVTIQVTGSGSGIAQVCSFEVTVADYDGPVQDFLSCSNGNAVSLNADCKAELGAEDVLEGGPYSCFDDYTVVETDADKNVIGDNIIEGLGIHYYMVSGPGVAPCWGYVLAEDKTPPVLTCDTVTVECTADTSPAGIAGPQVDETCGGVTLEYDDVAIHGDCADGFLKQIRRTWTATNASGMSDECVQLIIVERAELDDILAPKNFDGDEEPSFLCTDFPENPGLIPDADGYISIHRDCKETNFNTPLFVAAGTTLSGLEFTFSDIQSMAEVVEAKLSKEFDKDAATVTFSLTSPEGTTRSNNSILNGFDGENPAGTWSLSITSNKDINVTLLDLGIKYRVYTGPIGATCDNIQYGYTDTSIDNICEGSYKILREWKILDWCAPGDVRTYYQVLKVEDKKAPTIAPLADLSVSTDFDKCSADVLLPVPELADDCSSNITYSIKLDTDEGTLAALPSGGYILLDLPIGMHQVTYTAVDDCDNKSSRTLKITVADDIIPAAVCETYHQVSLQNTDAQTPTLVSASVFDDGSWDNCGILKFEARRMTSTIDFDWTTNGYQCDANAECQPDSDPDGFVRWFDQGIDRPGPIDLWYCKIPFACSDAGTTVMVEFRVTDVNGNTNTCMVEIEVVDKVNPIISCPPNKTIECHDAIPAISEDLVDEGAPVYAGTPTDSPDPANFLGYYQGAYDNCSVTVFVRETGGVDECGLGTFTRRWQARDHAGNLSATCFQRIFVINSDPFEIVDTENKCFPISNDHPEDPFGPHSLNDDVEWPCDAEVNCTNGNTEPFDADTNPNGVDIPWITEDACDLVAVTHEDTNLPVIGSECEKILRKWIIVDWCQFEEFQGTPTAGYWTYTQIIKVFDNIDPVIDPATCGNGPSVDADPNTCLGLVPLVGIASDVCTNDADLNWYYEIDADNDGTIDITGTGNDASGFFPIGGHRIKWHVEDNCGNKAGCEQLFYVVDNTDPQVYALTSVDVSLIANGNGTGTGVIWASELDLGSFDDCSGIEEILISNPSGGLGQSSPNPATSGTGAEFDCSDVGLPVAVDLWVRDGAGNWAYVIVQVVVEDNNGQACSSAPVIVSISGSIANEENQMVENVTVSIDGNTSNMPGDVVTTEEGNFSFDVAAGNNYSVTPERNDNPLNGISTYDLVLISQHILGIAQLDSPYKMIAADVNNSGTITSYDMVELRKLILFINTEFPSNNSWRFVDGDFVFPDATNPFASTFPEVTNYNNLSTSELAEFVAVKIGDVNGSAAANSLAGGDTRNAEGELAFNIDNAELTAGQEYTVEFKAKDFAGIAGYQFSLNFDKTAVEFVDFQAGALRSLTSDNFGFAKLNEGVITSSWNGQDATTVADDEVLFSLTFKAKRSADLSSSLDLSSNYTAAEAYNADADLLDLALEFNGTTAEASEFALFQNQPNPFKNETVIGFELPEAANATITIYDVAGRTLKLIEGEFAKGFNQVTVNRGDLNGTGVLYYQLDTPNNSATKKMILVD